MKAVLVTYTYPGAEKWIPAFVRSVLKQTSQNFDVIAFQDEVDYSPYFSKLNSFKSVVLNGCASPFEVRKVSLNQLKKIGADRVIVFADIDDELSKDRIKITLERFVEPDVGLLVSNFETIDSTGSVLEPSYWGERLPLKFTANEILDFNFCGFGNVAIRPVLIQENIPSAPLIASDWFFFYGLLKDSGIVAHGDDRAMIRYRQHSENESGLGLIAPEKLSKALDVVILHFKALNNRYSEGIYAERVNELSKLKVIFQNEEQFLETFDKVSKMIPKHRFWWEEINYLRKLVKL